jgi:hypothetical protein
MTQRILSLLILFTLLIGNGTIAFADQHDTTSEKDAESSTEAPNPSEDKSYQEKLNILIPSQESLFDNSKRNDANQDGQISDNERIRLADGDLEQGLAPKLLKILIQFSPIAITVFFVFAGVRLILSRGNEDAYTNTKNMIVQALIGFVLITASFGIIIGIIRLFDSL